MTRRGEGPRILLGVVCFRLLVYNKHVEGEGQMDFQLFVCVPAC